MRHIDDYRAPVVLHPILLKPSTPTSTTTPRGTSRWAAATTSTARSRPDSATSSRGTSSGSTPASPTSPGSSGAAPTSATAQQGPPAPEHRRLTCAPGWSSLVAGAAAGGMRRRPEADGPRRRRPSKAPIPRRPTGRDRPTSRRREEPASLDGAVPGPVEDAVTSAAGGRCDGPPAPGRAAEDHEKTIDAPDGTSGSPTPDRRPVRRDRGRARAGEPTGWPQSRAGDRRANLSLTATPTSRPPAAARGRSARAGRARHHESAATTAWRHRSRGRPVATRSLRRHPARESPTRPSPRRDRRDDLRRRPGFLPHPQPGGGSGLHAARRRRGVRGLGGGRDRDRSGLGRVAKSADRDLRAYVDAGPARSVRSGTTARSPGAATRRTSCATRSAPRPAGCCASDRRRDEVVYESPGPAGPSCPRRAAAAPTSR